MQRTHQMVLYTNPKPNPKYAHISTISPSTQSHHTHTNTSDHSSLYTEPSSYTQSIKHQYWRHSMDQEIIALYQTKTWTLVLKPTNVNIIRNRWIYKIKRHTDGTIERYKARLMTKGYTQEYGLDYIKTFSLVIKPITIRTVISVALSQQWYFG